MTGQIEAIDRFCVYGVAVGYDELLRVVQYRVDELQATHEAIDGLSGLQSGYTSKIMASIKSMGRVSMGPTLDTLGLALIVVRDDERFARIKDRLPRRERPKPAMDGSTKPAWLFRGKKAREMGKKRFSTMTEAQLRRHQRKAAKARWHKHRMEAAE